MQDESAISNNSYISDLKRLNQISQQSPPPITFDKFNNSCRHILKHQFGEEPYAKFLSVKSIYQKFCIHMQNHPQKEEEK